MERGIVGRGDGEGNSRKGDGEGNSRKGGWRGE